MISWNFYIFQICTTSILILPAIIYDIQYEDYFINLILANWISLRENLWKLFAPLYNSVET